MWTFNALHLPKLVRNALGDCRVFINDNGDFIKWEYLEKLHNLQLTEGVHCADKISQKHMDWRKNKMKVSLAAQTLSRSAASSIAFCRDDMKMKEFAESEATCEFLLIFNDLFDVLNSKSGRAQFLKGPMAQKTERYWRPVLLRARDYILGLKHPNTDKLLVKGPRKQAFAGFVFLIDGILDIYDNYVLHGELDFMLTFKLSQGTKRLNTCLYSNFYLMRNMEMSLTVFTGGS